MSYLTINFEAGLLRQAKNYAASQGLSLNKIVRDYLVEITNATEKTSPSPSSTDKLPVLQQANERRLEQERKAKQELEDIMAMFAHKFRGPLQSLQYNAEHENQTMTGLLNIFSTVSTSASELRQKISQERQGDRTLASVLVKSLSMAITQLLTVNNMDKIVQHYLSYAQAQIPSTATREQLMDEYLDIWENLQTQWENSFMQLGVKSDDLTLLIAWIQERFFPIEIVGFDDNLIHFKQYGVTESVFIIIMTEMLLNAIKYYSSARAEPVIVRWESQKEVCKFVCENPTTQIERDSPKGSHKGHTFLNTIARKLQGHFAQTLEQDHYIAEFSLPSHLLIKFPLQKE
jgi:signal transduction histidine kinase